MRQKSGPQETAEQHVRDIRRKTRRRYSAEEKIRIVLEGLRGEYSIAEASDWKAGRMKPPDADDAEFIPLPDEPPPPAMP